MLQTDIQTTEPSELEIIFDGSELKLSTGEKCTVHAFRFKDFQKVLKILSEFSDVLGSLDADSNGLAIASILSAEGSTEQIVDIICTAIRDERPERKQWIEDLEMDNAIALLSAVITKNVSFFKEKVAPQISQLGKVLRTDGEPDGATQS